MNAEIQRPHYYATELKTALASDWRGWHLSEKMDGVFALREFAGCVVTGEAMRDGRLFVFDIPFAFGQDVRRRPWTERHAALDQLFAGLPAKLNWHRCATGHGAEFIEAVLSRGGEGCVAKPWHGFYGFDYYKVKRIETHEALITAKHMDKRSVQLGCRGWCQLPARMFEQVTVGAVIEIACDSIAPSGKFKQPRFIRTRPDKGESK